MIFVAVGTQKFQLNRLIKEIDTLVHSKEIKEKVFAQIGNSDYIPENYEYKQFLTKDDFDLHIRQCSLLITHSGVGTIISGVKYHKPIIVFPRLSEYGEHIDDHQMQIAQTFSDQGLVLLCKEESKLVQVIETAKTFEFKEYYSQRENIINEIRNFLQNDK